MSFQVVSCIWVVGDGVGWLGTTGIFCDDLHPDKTIVRKTNAKIKLLMILWLFVSVSTYDIVE